MKRIILFVVAVVGGVFCGSSRADDKREATYEGKPLAYWLERLQSEKDDRWKASRAIREFGPDAGPAVPVLVELLIDDRSADFRKEVGSILSQLRPVAKSAVPALTRALKENKARSRGEVIWVLRALGPDAKEAVPILIAIIENQEVVPSENGFTTRSEPEHLDTAAIFALEAIGPAAKEAVPALIKALETPRLRHTAIYALCHIGPGKDGLAAIGAAIRDAKNHDKEMEKLGREYRYDYLLGLLGSLDSAAVPLLVEFLDDNDPYFQVKSVETLSALGLGARKSLPALRKKLHVDMNPSVRIAAARALWKLDLSTDGVPVLLALMAEDKETYDAAKVLGEMGPAANFALPELEKMVARLDPMDDSKARRRKYIQEMAIDQIKADETPKVNER